MAWQNTYLERYYYSQPGWRGGTVTFLDMIKAHVPADSEVLEIGCGKENPVSTFLAANFRAVDGLDLDPACEGNPALRSSHIYDGGSWPFPDASYDAVVANYVLEHVESPRKLLKELHRVLRPGGTFIFRTPNKWHYVSLTSRCTPHWVHERLANRLRNLDDADCKPFPTFYRMNSVSTLRKLMQGEHFEECLLEATEKEPHYGLCCRGLFLIFTAYERVVNSTPRLAGLRSNLLGVYRRME